VVYILGGLVALLLLYAASRWFVRADPAQVTVALKVAAVSIALVGVVLLAVAGRIGLVVMAASLLVPLYMRWRKARRLAGANPGHGPAPSGGGTSRVDTTYFAMTLDHESGALDGEVRKGPQRGLRLSTLELPTLLGLLSECSDDAASQQVLTAYLDRHHDGWRETAAPGAAGHKASETTDTAVLTPVEAYRILGLEPGADAAAIKEAHHRLMKKFHPDQGGSAWFAARINEARDLLLRL
jgi:hypothetical protein